MKLRAGGFAWLLAHELRINWRGLADMIPGASPRLITAVLLVVAAGLHLAAWPAVFWLHRQDHAAHASGLPLAAIIGGVFTWMAAQSVFGATRALYDRADLDLLLSSPLPAIRIVAAKLVTITAGTLGSIAILAAPLANMGAVLDSPAWLAVYPALAGLALIATSVGLSIAMGLFMAVGPRRARLYANLTGASLGGVFVLGAQVYAVLPAAVRAKMAGWLNQADLLPRDGPPMLLWLPEQAVLGNLAAICVLLAAGLAIFAATVFFMGQRFAAAAVSAAGAPAPGEPRGRSGARTPFRSGASANLRRKEWRLMLRDPSFFAQLGLQIIYTIPIAVVLLRSNLVPAAFAMVPTLVVIAGQLAGSIAWITMSGEDAPELIATAPITQATVERVKLSAVAPAVLAILALPLIGLASLSWRLALITAAFAAASSTSTALINFWHPMPGNRRGMLRRHSQSKLVGLAEHGLAMLWAFAAVFAAVGSLVALVPLTIIAAILGAAWARHRRSARGYGASNPNQTPVAGLSSLEPKAG